MPALFVLTTLTLLVGLSWADDKQSTDKKTDLDVKKLIGDWTFVSGMKRGEKVEGVSLAGKITFAKDELKMPGPDGQVFTIGFKIDTKHSPPTIEMEIKDGQFQGAKASGIIELKGEELHFLYVPQMGEDVKPPTRFESTAENGAFYFILKRAKKD